MTNILARKLTPRLARKARQDHLEFGKEHTKTQLLLLFNNLIFFLNKTLCQLLTLTKNCRFLKMTSILASKLMPGSAKSNLASFIFESPTLKKKTKTNMLNLLSITKS